VRPRPSPPRFESQPARVAEVEPALAWGTSEVDSRQDPTTTALQGRTTFEVSMRAAGTPARAPTPPPPTSGCLPPWTSHLAGRPELRSRPTPDGIDQMSNKIVPHPRYSNGGRDLASEEIAALMAATHSRCHPRMRARCALLALARGPSSVKISSTYPGNSAAGPAAAAARTAHAEIGSTPFSSRRRISRASLKPFSVSGRSSRAANLETV
jgi:hypothetical protein